MGLDKEGMDHPSIQHDQMVDLVAVAVVPMGAATDLVVAVGIPVEQVVIVVGPAAAVAPLIMGRTKTMNRRYAMVMAK